MTKVNAFDEDSLLVPAYQVIIERLKSVSKTESDAALSKWLGKTSTFIATCKNREGISLDVVVPKLDNKQLLYVLRGETNASQEEVYFPPSRLARVWSVLDGADADRLAVRIGITPQRAKGLIAGKAQPTATELASLLDEVTGVALTLTSVLRSSSTGSHSHELLEGNSR